MVAEKNIVFQINHGHSLKCGYPVVLVLMSLSRDYHIFFSAEGGILSDLLKLSRVFKNLSMFS